MDKTNKALGDTCAANGKKWGIYGPWKMPAWMERYRNTICGTEGHPVEWIMSLGADDTWDMAKICTQVQAQVILLMWLKASGGLTDVAADAEEE